MALSLICIRGSADKSAENIVDPLLTDISVMKERARVLFNQEESNRIKSVNLVPLKPFVLPTSLIRLYNFDDEVHPAIIDSVDIRISISENDVTMETQMVVERLGL